MVIMKTKLEMAHEWAMQAIDTGYVCETGTLVIEAWQYADAMMVEADKRSKAEAEQKRKAVREILNAPNTFVEREGQHFDNVEWQPDWSQAPDWANWWAMDEDKKTRWIYSELEQPYTSDTFLRWFALGRFDSEDAPSFGYTGDWRNSLRKRPE